MLSLAKIESGTVKINPSEINLSDMLINIMISQEQRIIEKNISVEGLEFVSGIKITADKDLIYQVIYNLVDNAIKFWKIRGVANRSVIVDYLGKPRFFGIFLVLLVQLTNLSQRDGFVFVVHIQQKQSNF
jgi:light-regulated signal transduction histidine kinase (bacteriophytochrome)